MDTDQDQDHVDQSRLQKLLGYQLTRAELHVHRKFVEHTSSFSLRPVEYSILVLIDSNCGINQRQIGDALGISPPNLVGVIARLIKRRLLRRVRSRQDKRVQHLHLSETGHELLKEVEAEIVRFDKALLASLTATERKVLEAALQKIMRL